GGIDLLVDNAGGSVGGGLLEATPEDWVRTFELNLLHAVSAVRAAAPHMQSRGGGSALLVASISGWKPVHRRAQYGRWRAGCAIGVVMAVRPPANPDFFSDNRYSKPTPDPLTPRARHRSRGCRRSAGKGLAPGVRRYGFARWSFH